VSKNPDPAKVNQRLKKKKTDNKGMKVSEKATDSMGASSITSGQLLLFSTVQFLTRLKWKVVGI